MLSTYTIGVLQNEKNSAGDGDRDETVFSEIYCGGYFTADDKVAHPKYLVHLPSQNDVIVDIDFYEGLNERVNSGDSDDDGYASW